MAWGRIVRRLPFVGALLAALLLTALLAVAPAAAQSAGDDFALADGHFYTQTRGDHPAGFGFAIRDTTSCPCFSQFTALGGIAALGYPASHPYQDGPFTYQVTQRALLQWNTITGTMSLANVFDLLHAAGRDEWLETFKQIPSSFDWSSDQGRPFSGPGSITENHLTTIFAPRASDSATMRAARQALEGRFLANPQWLNHHGFPMGIKDYGHVVVVRGQRAAFQYWQQDVPWAAAGTVTIVLGGGLAKEAGLFPTWAATPLKPEAATSVALRPAPPPPPAPTAAPAPPPQAAEPHAPPAAQVRADWLGVNDGYAASGFLAQSGAGWTRSVIFWSGAERSDGDFSGIRGCPWVNDGLKAANVKMLGLLIGTPDFAATNPADGTHSVPDMAKWARFVAAIARECAGTIDHWAIWNEVEIPPSGPNAIYSTFAGSAAQYYQLLKTAYTAAKRGNPNAQVIVAPYSYHRDMQEGGEQRLPWFAAFMAQVKADPAAPANGGFFDALALNIYRNPHDLWDRVHGGGEVALLPPNRSGFAQRLADIGLAGKPIWLAEFNAMPFDDANVPGWDTQIANDGFRITMDEQASFVIQALTLGRLAGYERMFFHALQDDRYPALGGRQFDELWGLVRFHDDPNNVAASRQRPAFTAFQTVARFLGNATPRGLEVLERADDPVARWSQYTPRFTWHVHAGIFERAIAGGIQRSTVLWNGAGTPITVLVPKVGVHGWLVSKDGAAKIIRPVTVDGRAYWSIELAAASRHFDLFGGDPPGYYYVGGSPLILVEEGVPAGSPLAAPRAAS